MGSEQARIPHIPGSPNRLAGLPQIIARGAASVIVRMSTPEFGQLISLVFRRYPRMEWASFVRLGWRETPGGLVLTLSGIDEPGAGDLDAQVSHVAIREPYTVRVALSAEKHPLAIGVVHSHPENCVPRPSAIDDDMDSYYGQYFADFAPGRPYASIIVSRIDGKLGISGRVHWRGAWSQVNQFVIERNPTRTWIGGDRPADDQPTPERTARLTAAFGREASANLRRSSVAVIGAGGTGSAAIEALARAGVGRIVVVDPDRLDESNLERIHGSRPSHAQRRELKVKVAKEHVKTINPQCDVVALAGAVPQGDVVDAVVTCDLALGCTDQQHSRLALSDLAVRYLVPVLDCGVALEGGDGRVTGQVLQITRFLAADPCALCRGMIIPERIAQELMPPEERAHRRAAARDAGERGALGYWLGPPQLNTVGYLTTIAGAMVAGYAIGWLTGRFDASFDRLQADLTAKALGVAEPGDEARPDCVCRRIRGYADQGAAEALISAPPHWPVVQSV